MIKLRDLLMSILFVLLIMGCQPKEPELHIYLCFGQSNMEGQGIISEDDKIENDRFLVYQALDCPNLNRKKEQWYPAVPPLSQCETGLSPSAYFGKTMITALPDHIKVGIISVAIGGCDIRLFDKDLYTDHDSTYAADWFVNKIKYYEGNPYQYLINLAKKAQNDGTIKGILLHQGETNTGDKQWPQYVKKIYNDMISDLSLDSKTVPLLAGELVDQDSSCCASMNPIINQLPSVIPNAHVISSKDCTAADNAHFDAEGYRELGKRYAKKMLELHPKG